MIRKRMVTETGFVIAVEADEVKMRTYIAHRDAVRDALGHGVYPNLVKALALYAEFDLALAGELADTGLLAYHESLMAPIVPYVAQLRELAAGIVEIMTVIEAASPGTFGIALPVAEPTEPPEPEPPVEPPEEKTT